MKPNNLKNLHEALKATQNRLINDYNRKQLEKEQQEEVNFDEDLGYTLEHIRGEQ